MCNQNFTYADYAQSLETQRRKVYLGTYSFIYNKAILFADFYCLQYLLIITFFSDVELDVYERDEQHIIGLILALSVFCFVTSITFVSWCRRHRKFDYQGEVCIIITQVATV